MESCTSEETRADDETEPEVSSYCGTVTQHGEKTEHQSIRNGEKPYSFTTSGKAPRVRSSLTVHNHTHTGEKPYSCTTCGKSFRQASTLAVHSLLHTLKKLTYLCQTCHKPFSDKKYLVRHERIHTGEKPSTDECDVNELDIPTIESEADTSIDCSKTSKDQRSPTTNRIQNVAGFNQVEVSDEVSRRDGSSYVHDQIRVDSVVQSDGEKRDSTENTKVSDAERTQSINIEGMYLCVWLDI